jgi:hypothetical protein
VQRYGSLSLVLFDLSHRDFFRMSMSRIHRDGLDFLKVLRLVFFPNHFIPAGKICVVQGRAK